MTNPCFVFLPLCIHSTLTRLGIIVWERQHTPSLLEVLKGVCSMSKPRNCSYGGQYVTPGLHWFLLQSSLSRAQRHSFTLTPWPNNTAGLSFLISHWIQISQNLLQSQNGGLRNTGPRPTMWHLLAMQQSTDSFLTKPSRGLVLQRFCSISQANTPRKLGMNPSWEKHLLPSQSLNQPPTQVVAAAAGLSFPKERGLLPTWQCVPDQTKQARTLL